MPQNEPLVPGADSYVYDPTKDVGQLDPTTPKVEHQANKAAQAIRQIISYLNNTDPDVSLQGKCAKIATNLALLLSWSSATKRTIPAIGQAVPVDGLLAYDPADYSLYRYKIVDGVISTVPMSLSSAYRPLYRKFDTPVSIYYQSPAAPVTFTYTTTQSERLAGLKPKGIVFALVRFVNTYTAGWAYQSFDYTAPIYTSGSYSEPIGLTFVPCETETGLHAAFGGPPLHPYDSQPQVSYKQELYGKILGVFYR
jgi:hypothetical protein